MNRLKIHFPLRENSADRPIDIGCALGIANSTPTRGNPGPEETKFDRFNSEAGQWFVPSTLEEADVVVYPYRAKDHPDEAVAVANLANARGLHCIFFSWGDENVTISVPHGTVYRQSLFADTRLPCEAAFPGYCSDPLAGGQFKPRSKQPIPSVGFCGFVSSPLMRLAYRTLGRAQKAEGLFLRAKAIRVLRRSPKVQTQFICRRSYWAGTIGRYHHDPKAQFGKWQEFLENLIGTDYTLCVRGAGNYSYRMYESLAAGRIPLFINTKCVLPFEDQIDWKRHCVWVEEKDLPQAGEILADFHGKLTDEQFAAMQADNRKLWEDRLTPLGFYRHALQNAVSLSVR